MFSNKFKILLKFIIILIIPINFGIINLTNYIKENHIKNLFLKMKDFETKNKKIYKDIEGFRRINSENILLDKKKYKKANNPIISIIVTVYNQIHCIHKSIRSIQNQSIKNLEIIIVDDCSSDNSIEILKRYQKEDSRITILIHKTNLGKIKSRTDGIKIAKGKYITVLDGDDGLIHKDILKNSLYIANLGNLDIVEFKIITFIKGEKRGCLNTYIMETNNIIYQPILRTKFFLLGNAPKYRAVQNRNICGKIIKNKIYQKVLNRIGPKYTEDYILGYEDTMMTVALFQVANSYYYMKEEGYYYSRDDKISNLSLIIKKTKPKENVIKGMDAIKFLQFLIEKTRNNKIERQLIYFELISIDYYWNFYKYINHHFKMVYDILEKMIISRFLLEDQKQILILMKKNLKEKERHLLSISIKK
jgi:glycosyltransferase involved in cell wall biosynthesis